MTKLSNFFSLLKEFYQTKKGKIIFWVGLSLLTLFVLLIIMINYGNSAGNSVTDASGTVWLKSNGSNEPLFKVFMEQTKTGETSAVNNECDPKVDYANLTAMKETIEYNSRNGFDKPNNCRIVAGQFRGLTSDGNYANTFVLLPDGSL